MIPETENAQEAKSVCPGQPARHAQADLGRYITQSPQCWFSRGTARIIISNNTTDLIYVNSLTIYYFVQSVVQNFITLVETLRLSIGSKSFFRLINRCVIVVMVSVHMNLIKTRPKFRCCSKRPYRLSHMWAPIPPTFLSFK